MPSSTDVVCAVGLLCVLSLPVADASAVTIEDGEFLSENWGTQLVLQEGAGSGSVTRLTTGGNPGAFLELSTRSGWELGIWVQAWKTDLVWDPAADGEIISVTLEIDERAIDSFGNGQKRLTIEVGGPSQTDATTWGRIRAHYR